MELTLNTPVQYIPLVGPSRAAALERLGIAFVKDLLYHIPFRYNDFSLVTPIGRAQPGETVTILGTVESMKTFVTKNGKRIIEGTIADDSGRIKTIWFNQYFLMRVLGEGDLVSFSGEVSWFGNKIVLSNPQFEILSSQRPGAETLHTGRIVPVYSETEGITSKWLRNRIHFLLSSLNTQLADYLPDPIRTHHNLLELAKALYAIHFPASLDEANTARRRLGFDELLGVQTRAMLRKKEWQKNNTAKPIVINQKTITEFIDSLPFMLTSDQQVVIKHILADIRQAIPMNRLLIGDVGSGKTIVATLAMYATYLAGHSSMLMAPTQILAEQHYATMQKLLSPLGITIDLVTGSKKTVSKEESADINLSLFDTVTKRIIVGTHALLAYQSHIKDLTLVVIDEQHRFGVKQRATLLAKASDKTTPHLLTMTATPIPRTIAKTIFGNLDLSLLSESPQGRQKIKTWLVPNEKRTRAYEWIRKHVSETDGQIFIICPLIEVSEDETMATVKAVTHEYEIIQKTFPEYSVGLLHGRMKPKEKTAVLEDFRKKTHEILLATPVVEVGIDIPNATVIMIEGADRFGLGQLHQLRGRVGRSDKQSYCLLFSENTEEITLLRLKAMESIHNGPDLAELDLKLRGPGDVFGTRQHGVPLLKIARFSDLPLIEETRQAAEKILDEDPELQNLPYLRELAKTDIITEVVSD